MRYGEVPPGGKELAPAEPLQENVLYFVLVSGMGYIGGAIFGQIGRKLIVVRGSGDAPIQDARSRFNQARLAAPAAVN